MQVKQCFCFVLFSNLTAYFDFLSTVIHVTRLTISPSGSTLHIQKHCPFSDFPFVHFNLRKKHNSLLLFVFYFTFWLTKLPRKSLSLALGGLKDGPDFMQYVLCLSRTLSSSRLSAVLVLFFLINYQLHPLGFIFYLHPSKKNSCGQA